MSNQFIEDIWESSGSLVISDVSESGDNVIDGTHIIGRVVGECFFPGGISRNRRVYSEGLWNKTISKLDKSEVFKNRKMIGTVGHDQPIDEAAILDGKITHIVSKLWINEDNKGMGEFLILGTTGGRNLYTLLKAGNKINFSTRASGSYVGKDRNGNDIMDESTYDLKTVDFVVDPGFLNALPSIIESNVTNSLGNDGAQVNQEPINPIEPRKQLTEGNTMSDASKEFVDHLKSENAEIKADRDKLLSQVSELTAQLDTLNAKVAELTAQDATAGEVAKELEVAQKELGDTQAALKQAQDKLDAYNELGEPDEVQEALNKAAAQVARLVAIENNLGSYEDIETALATSESYVQTNSDKVKELRAQLAAYEALGSVDDIKTVIDGYSEFHETFGTTKDIATFMNRVAEFQNEYGSFEAVCEALDKTHKFVKKYGTFSKVTKTLDEANKFVKTNGSFTQVSKALDMSLKKIRESEEKEHQEMVNRLCDDLDIPEDVVKNMLDKGMTETEIRDAFSSQGKKSDESKKRAARNESVVSGASYLMGAPRKMSTTAPAKSGRSMNESKGTGQGQLSLAARLMGR